MPNCSDQQLQLCCDLQSVLDCVLSRSLELTGADLGNVQLMNWSTGHLTIAAQRGFDDNFLRTFCIVHLRDGSACGRALRERRPIVIDDVLRDREFAPYRTVAIEAGFRAVQSTPLISSSGAFVGVLSTHFAKRHSPSDSEMQAVKTAAKAAANAIIAQKAKQSAEQCSSIIEGQKRIERSFAALRDSSAFLVEPALWLNKRRPPHS